MKYTVIKNEKLNYLCSMVNEHLAKGWLLQGGIHFTGNNYLQAMFHAG